MLPPDYLDGLEGQIAKIYGDLEINIIEEISKRILNVGYANTVVKNDAIIAQQAGMLYSDIIEAVSKNTQKSYDEIEKIFTEAGIKAIKNDDKIYKKHGLNPLPIKQDKNMLDFITSTAKQTNRNLNNLTRTTASSSQQDFYNIMNKAYIEVSTGVKSYSQAIIDSIDDLAEKGTSITYPSGHKTSLENATRMNILTSVNSNCGRMQIMRAEEMGCTLMEISAHGGARPEHAEWQGKIVDITGKNKKYLNLDDIGYGTATGFQGVNCRHTWFPYYEGDVRTYSDSELKEINNGKITYNGQKISTYAASQIQRKMENTIRTDKKKIAGREQLLTSESKEISRKEIESQLNYYKAKLKLDNDKLNDFNKQTKFKKDSTRLKISQKGTYNTKKVENYAKKLYNKDEIDENIKDFINDETIRKHIRNKKGKKFENQNVFTGKQNKHIVGTNEYKTLVSQNRNPSKVILNNEEIQNLVDRYAGTGRILRDKNRNSTDIELIISDDYVGYAVNKEGQTLTKKAEIHYSKNGVHVVPTTRRK